MQSTTVGEIMPLETKVDLPAEVVVPGIDTSHFPVLKKDTTINKIKEIKPVLKPDDHIKMGIVATVPIKKDPPKTDQNNCEGKPMY